MNYIVITSKDAGSISTASTMISWSGPGDIGTVNYTIRESDTYLLIALRELPTDWSNPSSVFASDGTIVANDLDIGLKAVIAESSNFVHNLASGLIGAAIGYNVKK